MDKYKFITYLKYRWQAKGRHSIHSPFVYNMFENCIIKNAFVNDNNSNKFSERIDEKKGFIKSLFQKGIINNVKIIDPETDYLFNSDDNINLDNIQDIKQLYLLNAEVNIEDSSLIFKKIGVGLIFIDNIFKNKQSTKNWNKISKSKNVTLSINFYHFGIISTNTDFTKQYFILKF